MKTFVIYHANCVDGFGAAFAAWRALGSNNVEYIPLNHYDPMPFFSTGSKIYCLDFCFKKEEILQIIQHSSLTIVDHHISELRSIVDILHMDHPNLEIIFNMEQSGATLAWNYFHKQPTPDFFQHIEDRDLGKYQLENTKEIISALMLKPKTFQEWEKISTQKLLLEGEIFKNFQEQILKETLERHHFAEIHGKVIPVVNSTCFWSDITFKLLDLYPEHDFVASYYAIDEQRIKWSIRSREGSSVDVGLISQEYEGGGHFHSGGFTTKKDQIVFCKQFKIAA